MSDFANKLISDNASNLEDLLKKEANKDPRQKENIDELLSVIKNLEQYTCEDSVNTKGGADKAVLNENRVGAINECGPINDCGPTN